MKERVTGETWTPLDNIESWLNIYGRNVLSGERNALATVIRGAVKGNGKYSS